MRKSQTDLMLFGNTKQGRENTLLLDFPTMGAFLDAVNAVDAPRGAGMAEEGERGFNGYTYYQTHSLREANEYAINGVPGTEERVKTLTASIKAGAGHLEEYTYRERSVVGGRPNRSAYLTGEPRNMWRIRHSHREGGKIITLNVGIAFNGGVSGGLIERRGAAIIALSELLEENGYRTEIYGIDSSKGRTLAVYTRICLKRAQDFPEISRLYYALAHPSMVRRHVFRLQEGLPDKYVIDIGFNAGGGYGNPVDASLEEWPSDIILQGDSINTQINFSSDSSAQEWVKKQLKEQGIAEEE